MVSIESGRAGGFLEKYQAAKETGCRMIVIGRPKEEQGMELEKCIEYLDRRFLSKENVANDAKIPAAGRKRLRRNLSCRKQQRKIQKR